MTLSLLDWLLLALSVALALACVWYEHHCAALQRRAASCLDSGWQSYAVARGVVDELAAVATNWDFPLAPNCDNFSKRV